MLPVSLRILKNLPNDSTVYSYCFFCPDSVIVWDGFSHLIVINLMSFHVRDMCCSDHDMLLKSPRRRSLLSFNEQPIENAVPRWFCNNWFHQSVMCCDLMSHISYNYWRQWCWFFDRIRSSFGVATMKSCRHNFGQVVLYNKKVSMFAFLDIPEYFLHKLFQIFWGWLITSVN